MSPNSFFSNKRDQSDFLIALVVIGFFLWLTLFSGFFGNKISPKALLTTNPTELHTDQGAISDQIDESPNVFAETMNGYPESVDGIENDIHAKSYNNGSAIIGKQNNYCPHCEGRVQNCKKTCPRKAKMKGKKNCDCKNKNCAHKNKIDSLTGVEPQTIVPVTPQKEMEDSEMDDKDGDGIADEMDKCPDTKGDPNTKGCPDSDKDGVMDKEDNCPNVVGTKENDGCPKLVLEKEEEEVIQEAIANVNFEFGKANLTAESKPILDKIVSLMEKYPNSQLTISGHTDNDSNSSFNLQLSRERAANCKIYLINKGVANSRITANGYGETKPIASNNTEQGREKNRRVEFDLH